MECKCVYMAYKDIYKFDYFDIMAHGIKKERKWAHSTWK